MQVEEIFIWGSLLRRGLFRAVDYYYKTTSSVANQNAGFALVLHLGDTKMALVGCQLQALSKTLNITRLETEKGAFAVARAGDAFTSVRSCLLNTL